MLQGKCSWEGKILASRCCGPQGSIADGSYASTWRPQTTSYWESLGGWRSLKFNWRAELQDHGPGPLVGECCSPNSKWQEWNCLSWGATETWGLVGPLDWAETSSPYLHVQVRQAPVPAPAPAFGLCKPLGLKKIKWSEVTPWRRHWSSC